METKAVMIQIAENGDVTFSEGAIEAMIEFCTSGLQSVVMCGMQKDAAQTAKQLEAISCLLFAFSRLSAVLVFGTKLEADAVKEVMIKCDTASTIMSELITNEPASPSNIH